MVILEKSVAALQLEFASSVQGLRSDIEKLRISIAASSTIFTRFNVFDGNPTLGIRNLLDVEAPRVGVLTRFVSVFVFVLIFGFSNFDFRNDNYFHVNYISDAE